MLDPIHFDELLAVAKRLDEFVFYQMRQNRLAQARTELIKIRQEIEKQFGHYDSVRRTTQGILQSNDIGLVRKNTIETATEELMNKDVFFSSRCNASFKALSASSFLSVIQADSATKHGACFSCWFVAVQIEI